MKQTILGMGRDAFAKRLKTRIVIVITLAALTVLLNVLFCIMRNDENHGLMLGFNIAADTLCLWFLIYYLSFFVLPENSLLKLYDKKRSLLCGEILSVSNETVRVQGFDCYKIAVLENEERTLFLPDTGTVTINANSTLKLSVVSGIIAEVEE